MNSSMNRNTSMLKSISSGDSGRTSLSSPSHSQGPSSALLPVFLWTGGISPAGYKTYILQSSSSHFPTQSSPLYPAEATSLNGRCRRNVT